MCCAVSVAWAPQRGCPSCSGAWTLFLWKRHRSSVQLQRGAGRGSWRCCASFWLLSALFSPWECERSSCAGIAPAWALTLLTRKRKRGCPCAACVDPVRHGMECWLVPLESLYTLPLPCTDLPRHVRKAFSVLEPWLACVSPSYSDCCVSSALLILENRGSRYRHIPTACLIAGQCLLGIGIRSPFLRCWLC